MWPRSARTSDVKLYKEFEVSPQGEWVNLDIDLHKPHHEVGWTWKRPHASIVRRIAGMPR